jgi:hypothetical protein
VGRRCHDSGEFRDGGIAFDGEALTEPVLRISASKSSGSFPANGIELALTNVPSPVKRSIATSMSFSRVKYSEEGLRSGAGDSVALADLSTRSAVLGVPTGESFVGEIDLARSM